MTDLLIVSGWTDMSLLKAYGGTAGEMFDFDSFLTSSWSRCVCCCVVIRLVAIVNVCVVLFFG